MTPHEERLVLELHSKWGNRWSRIARKLPGRTDNEIKNYWRTHLRKKAQDKKRANSPSSSAVSNCTSLSSSTSPPVDSTNERNFYDTGGLVVDVLGKKKNDHGEETSGKVPSMDEIWNEIALSQDDTIKPLYCGSFSDEMCDFSCQTLASPIWDYSPDSPWMMDGGEESKMFVNPTSELFSSVYTG